MKHYVQFSREGDATFYSVSEDGKLKRVREEKPCIAILDNNRVDSVEFAFPEEYCGEDTMRFVKIRQADRQMRKIILEDGRVWNIMIGDVTQAGTTCIQVVAQKHTGDGRIQVVWQSSLMTVTIEKSLSADRYIYQHESTYLHDLERTLRSTIRRLQTGELAADFTKIHLDIHSLDSTKEATAEWIHGCDGEVTLRLGIPRGKPGAAGLTGKAGKDGKDGEDGKDGADGKDGKDGVDGKDGKDGVDGKDGKDGRDGVVTITNIATADSIGAIKVGSGLSVSEDGTLSVDRVSLGTLEQKQGEEDEEIIFSGGNA